MNINNSIIFLPETLFYNKEYYNYIINLLQDILNNNNFKLNLFIDQNKKIINNNKNIKIAINFEHTLIKQSGRDWTKNGDIAINSPIGNIIDNEGNNYLVRIHNINNIENADIIIDYCNANLENIKQCKEYSYLSNKHIYIAPYLYKPYISKNNRNIDILTTFIDLRDHLRRQRRRIFLENLKKNKIKGHTNINNCFDSNSLCSLLRRTKIIINIHQTDHHDTFEELRVLPALLNGVIVISEDVPLKEYIPYNDYIIWSKYEDIFNKIREISSNYDFYFDKIFNNNKNISLDKLHKYNYENLLKKINEIK
jgi:hypothetical protein